ncbi:MAG TPA: endonuclease MutS2 [Vicinamibacterales bacterium]
MHAGGLKALEFDRVVAAVRSFALTPTGAARLDELAPLTDATAVREALAATSEAVAYLESNPVFPLRAPEDLEVVLGLLEVQGRALEPLRLRALADHLDSITAAAAAVRRAGGAFPRLQRLVAAAASFEHETADVRRRISETGEIEDHASPALASIRTRMRRARTKLRSTLEGYLRGRDTAKYLQDQIVTERNGRFVLPVKAEHRGAIPGLVHGSSASGQTLYLEPLAVVEANNEIVALESEEAEEIQRILLELTDLFRGRLDDVRRSEAVATELDVLQAKARLAQITDATAPVLSQDGRIDLPDARHPLLMKAVVSRYSDDLDGLPDAPVPVTIRLLPPVTTLLITGPNTGGKTVALKTVGLLALMAQAGLHVPAAPGATLPVFKSVFADIGDEQSIAASLSTFGWHITNIASMDRGLRLPALVLLDEIGAGTDPIEGGALGVAIVDHFRTRGAIVVGTTHYDALKTYGQTTPGVQCAAFAFDPVGFAPTYQLVYGSPGRSLALEMAGRLGLSPQIISRAREALGTREAQLMTQLAQVDRDLQELAEQRRAVERERQAAAAARARIEQREEELRAREAAFSKKLHDRIDERVRAATREIDSVIQALKRQTSALASRDTALPRLSTGDHGALRAHAKAAVAAAAAKALGEGGETAAATAERPAGFLSRPAAVGDRVIVPPFGLEGVVKSLSGGQAEVDVHGKRLRAAASDLKVVAGATKEPAAGAKVRVNVDLAPREHATADLNVIGCTVDEALTRAERFLDETLVTDHRTVRVIHGHGTGKLQRAISGFLKDHPLVAAFYTAPAEHGGGGVTVVELKD